MQFNTAAITGPTYGSTGMESARNTMRGCATKDVDTSVVRRFRFWKFREARSFQFRADIFNTLNAVMISGRNSSPQYNNPTSMTLVNGEFNANGTIANGQIASAERRLRRCNGAQGMRNIQLEVRVTF